MKKRSGFLLPIFFVSLLFSQRGAGDPAAAATGAASSTAGSALLGPDAMACEKAGTSAVATLDSMVAAGSIAPSTAAAGKALSTAIKACIGATNTASMACVEGLNPKIQTAVSIVGTVLAGISPKASAKEQCDKSMSAMDIAKTAMTAYNLMCSGTKLRCDSSCANAKALLAKVEEARVPDITRAEAIMEPSGVLVVKSATESINAAAIAAVKSIGACESTCTKYSANMAAGAIGLISIINSHRASSNCGKDVTDTPAQCLVNSTDPVCIAKVDCTKPEYAGEKKCICEKTPTAAGCTGTNVAVNPTNPTPRTDVSSRENGVKSAADVGADAFPGFGGPGLDSAKFSGSDAAGGAGGLAGGAGGGVGGAAGSGKGPGVAGKAAGATRDSAVNAGDFGGGGGRGGGAGAGYADAKYDKYLPGKNAARGIASVPDVSGKAGQSNWEKVRKSYTENRLRLLSQ